MRAFNINPAPNDAHVVAVLLFLFSVPFTKGNVFIFDSYATVVSCVSVQKNSPYHVPHTWLAQDEEGGNMKLLSAIAHLSSMSS